MMCIQAEKNLFLLKNIAGSLGFFLFAGGVFSAPVQVAVLGLVFKGCWWISCLRWTPCFYGRIKGKKRENLRWFSDFSAWPHTGLWGWYSRLPLRIARHSRGAGVVTGSAVQVGSVVSWHTRGASPYLDGLWKFASKTRVMRTPKACITAVGRMESWNIFREQNHCHAIIIPSFSTRICEQKRIRILFFWLNLLRWKSNRRARPS